MHTSVPISSEIERIEETQVSPLLSHAKVKVCYVGQNPNRNKTVITKELATEMGKKLPGSPIVGLFDKETNDFSGHDREVVIKGGKFEMVDITRPYGFVPTNAEVWFQKFNDEGVEHEYLCTECYIWTGAYPESERIITEGNNQSMELCKEKGFWTNSYNSGSRIFIYNEALIERLCVLGENVEPCFEGAQFKSQFSLESSPEFQEFKTTMYSMIAQLQQSLDKGGTHMNPENQIPENEFAKNPEEKDKEKDKEQTPTSDSKPESGKPEEKGEEEKNNEKDKKKYNLDEVVEYQELNTKYTELQSQYAALQAEKETLTQEVTSLRQFKLAADRQSKQAMIDSFYMLSDEDKKDVVEHIDTYSVDDIEAKLAIICVKNKVNFNLEQDSTKGNAPQGMFNLNNISGEDGAPAWVKAVRATVKK